jgi:hypothetical protein
MLSSTGRVDPRVQLAKGDDTTTVMAMRRLARTKHKLLHCPGPFPSQRYLLLPRSTHGLFSELQQPVSRIFRVALAFSALSIRSGLQLAETTV